MIALLLELVGISPLAFGLGMYLPMSLNAPILVGALVAGAVKKGTKDESLQRARSGKGIIIASGFIAGAAIIGVMLNGLKSWGRTEPMMDAVDILSALINGGSDPASLGRVLNWVSLLAFLGLCAFLFWDARRAEADEDAPEIHM
jgi:hypothetical protein